METCANCGVYLDPKRNGRCVSDGDDPHEMCVLCSGIAVALEIGARREPVILYEQRGDAVSWMGAVMGRVVYKTVPSRSFSPARFRVRMLDDSVWYGTGPRSNGNYMSLRPLKRHGR